MRDAAEVLGNTPAIAKSSYVDPRVIDHYAHGRTIDPARLASAESELRSPALRLTPSGAGWRQWPVRRAVRVDAAATTALASRSTSAAVAAGERYVSPMAAAG